MSNPRDGDPDDDELMGAVKLGDLMGSAEVGDFLGVNRQRVNQIRHTRRFPRPLVQLKCGPIWRAADIRVFAQTWDRTPGPKKDEPRRQTVYPERAIPYLNVSIKVATTGLGWNPDDPMEAAFYQGVKTTAEMALSMMLWYGEGEPPDDGETPALNDALDGHQTKES